MDINKDFIGSFAFDFRLAKHDIEGSIAHVKMLSKQKIISLAEGAKITNGLLAILRDIEKGRKLPAAEDIHYAIEKELIRRIGPVGGKMHTARSRNDQVALDLRLYLRDAIQNINSQLIELQRAIVGLAVNNQKIVMPGYTHLQPAQPVLFAHYILAYAWMFQRDRDRLADSLKRVNVLPLGSAALAGTSFPIDRRYVAELLGFSKVSDNSIDAVSDRDFAAEFLANGALIAMHLSRLCEELVIWSSAEFNFIRIGDKFTSGSSIMPQKRNPDVAEIIRGKTGRIYGNLAALLTLLKGMPLSYNRDMQEDKPPVFDSVDTLSAVLPVASMMISSVRVNSLAMKKATERGFICATELADYLARKNVPFREAHGIVKKIVERCIANNISLAQCPLDVLKQYSKHFGADATQCLSPERVVAAKSSEGGTSPKSVEKQITALRKLAK